MMNDADNSNSKEKLRRLRWKSRRGMLELDLIFNRFLDEGYETLTLPQQVAFDALLDNEDDQLFRWLMGHEKPASQELTSLLDVINQSRDLK